MDQLNNIIVTSLNRYFKSLKTYGYVKYEHVNRLMLLIHISDLLEDFPFDITESDYRVFGEALYKLCGATCLIPYPKYLVETKLYTYKFNLRGTEDLLLRSTESNVLRTMAK